jgi:quinol monooxygenase YgiN
LTFRKDELVLGQHLESLADQVVEFSSERISLAKGLMPVIEMKPDKTIIEYWQTPYVQAVKHQVQALIKQLTESHTMHLLRKQLKMDEDPWDNYLIHDSKYFVPLLCHSQALPIEQQALLAAFIRQSLAEETISQYKLKGPALISELVKFAEHAFQDEEE